MMADGDEYEDRKVVKKKRERGQRETPAEAGVSLLIRSSQATGSIARVDYCPTPHPRDETVTGTCVDGKLMRPVLYALESAPS